MIYAHIKDGKIVKTANKPPYVLPDGRTRSNAHQLPPEGWVEVVDGGEPDHAENERAVRGPVEVVKGVPTVTYTVVERQPEPEPEPFVEPLTSDEIVALRALIAK